MSRVSFMMQQRAARILDYLAEPRTTPEVAKALRIDSKDASVYLKALLSLNKIHVVDTSKPSPKGGRPAKLYKTGPGPSQGPRLLKPPTIDPWIQGFYGMNKPTAATRFASHLNTHSRP